MSTWVVEQLPFIMALLRAFNQARALTRAMLLYRGILKKRSAFFPVLCNVDSRREGAQWIHGGEPWDKDLREIENDECDFIRYNFMIYFMWFHCLLIFAFSALNSGFKEQNLVMMALLRFYNISTLRVGGNTEFEGRKRIRRENSWSHSRKAAKAMTTNTIFTMMPPDLWKPRQFAGSLFDFSISDFSIFEYHFKVSSVAFVSTFARHFKASIRPKRSSKTEPFRFRDRQPRMYPWDSLAGRSRHRQKTEKKIAGIQNFFPVSFGFCALPCCLIPEKISVEHSEHPRTPRTCLGISLSKSFPRRSWHLAISVANRPKNLHHGSVLDKFLAWRDGREQKLHVAFLLQD